MIMMLMLVMMMTTSTRPRKNQALVKEKNPLEMIQTISSKLNSLIKLKRFYKNYATKRPPIPTSQVSKSDPTLSNDKDKMPTPQPIQIPSNMPRIQYPFIEPFVMSQEHSSKIFSLSKEFHDKMKALEYPTKILDEFSLLENHNVLLRKEAMDLYHQILSDYDNQTRTHDTQSCTVEELQLKRLKRRVLFLDGFSGVGKSHVLLQLVNLLYEAKKHIILYIPDGHQMTFGKYPYYPIHPTKANPLLEEVLAAEISEYDQPELSQKILKSILSLNKHHFVKDGGTFEKDIITFDVKGESNPLTISQAIDIGIHNTHEASNITRQIIDFFNNQKKLPFILIVDQINALFAKYEYYDTQSQRLDGDRLLPIKYLKGVFDNSYKLGSHALAIGAFSYTDTRIWSHQLGKIHQEMMIPLSKALSNDSQLSKNKTDECEKFYELIVVPPFNKTETLEILRYYKSLGFIFEENIEPIYLEKKFFVSGGNGRKLFQACHYDNIY